MIRVPDGWSTENSGVLLLIVVSLRRGNDAATAGSHDARRDARATQGNLPRRQTNGGGLRLLVVPPELSIKSRVPLRK